MTQTADYIISLIRALIQEQPALPMPEGITLQALRDFSSKHSMEAMVFRALYPTFADSQDPIWRDWEDRVNLLLVQSIVQLQERDNLIEVLTHNGIAVLPIKGCWLKELYPDIGDRQMSDLDMLIHPEDAASAEQALLAAGYRKEEVSFHDTTYHKPPYISLELHISLLPENSELTGYYQSIWEKAMSIEQTPGLYRLKPEDEYLYYIVHLSKHMAGGGSGLRSILDNSIYLRCFPDMDGAYLERELKKLGLLEFARQVQELSRCWFETGASIDEALEPLAQAVCAAGTYGSLEVRTHNRMERLREKHRNSVVCFFAYCLPRFFRPMSEMKRRYPVLEKAPILLPVFWVARIISKMRHNGRAFWQHLRSVLQEGGRHG